MKLSNKGRYAVRALFDIAFYNDGGPTQVKDIAERQSIPPRFLEQIFQDLKRAGLVDSKRGPRGGYYLKRPSSDITLSEVVRALQGPVEETFLLEEDEHNAAPGGGAPSSRQVTAGLWKELAEHVSSWFAGVTIADLVKRGNQIGVPRAGAGQPMYYI